MTKDKVRSTEEALRLALEAIKLANSSHNMVLTSDPPQSAWRYHNVDMTLREAITAIKAALEAKDEPIATKNNDGVTLHLGWDDLPVGTKLYTTPSQRTWVDATTWRGLTDDEILLISADCAATHQHTDIHFARAIEVKLKEKNYA